MGIDHIVMEGYSYVGAFVKLKFFWPQVGPFMKPVQPARLSAVLEIDL